MNNLKFLYMNKLKVFFTCILAFLFSHALLAQNEAPAGESAAILHQNGQIYLVVLVLVTIFAGIIFYLIRLEQKINKLEKKAKS